MPAVGRERLLAAAYACVSRFGMAKTTIEDVAKEAGVSRATVHRHFPGGRDPLLRAVIDDEVLRFFSRLQDAVQGSRNLAEVCVGGLAFGHRTLREHVVLQQVLRSEPQLLVPRLNATANRFQPYVRDFLLPYVNAECSHRRLASGLEPRLAADYVARLILSLINAPGVWDLEAADGVQEAVHVALCGIVPGMTVSTATMRPIDGETDPDYRRTVSSAPMLDAPVVPGSQEERIVDAGLVCIARWGLGKTSLDDVAREAGMSRATVYRAFPGGKDSLVAAIAATELARFFRAVDHRLAAADTVEDVLVAGMLEAGTRLAHHAALHALLMFEPEVVLPRLAFDGMDELLGVAARFAGPHLARVLPAGADPTVAEHLAEWATRIVISYASWPSVDVDLTDESSVRDLVRLFLLPAVPPTALFTDIEGAP
jgi:AcrR family transcriptional regulator